MTEDHPVYNSNQRTSDLVVFENKKSFAGMYNARRPDKELKFSSELAHFENQILTSQDKRLPACTQTSFQATILEAVSLGLSWNKRLAHCYPVRYGNTCTLSVGYQGLTHLCMKAGVLKSIQGEVVCVNDPVFENWVDEKGEHIKHTKSRLNRGDITHAYCIAHFNNGGYHIEVIEAEDLAKIQKASKMESGYIWKTWIIPMSIKAAIRRAWKFWPKDDGGRIETAMDAMDKYEPMDFGPPDPIEEEPQYITITEGEECALHSKVFDYYTEINDPNPGNVAKAWMAKLCEAMGITKLSQLPADRFDDAVAKINKRLDSVAKKQEQSA